MGQYVVTSSDNGCPVYSFGGANTGNYPLKGGKLSNWQVGICVNAFVSGEIHCYNLFNFSNSTSRLVG